MKKLFHHWTNGHKEAGPLVGQRARPCVCASQTAALTALATAFWILNGTIAAGFELRVRPLTDKDRHLLKRTVLLADGARAVEVEGGIQIIDKEGRPRRTIRKAGIRWFTSSRGTDLVAGTDNSVHVCDSAGEEKAAHAELEKPSPILAKGALVGFADSRSLRKGTMRVSLLTEHYKVRRRFSVPSRYRLLDVDRALGVVSLIGGHVPFEPQHVSIWKGGEKLCDLARENVQQRLAIFPAPYGGPIYLWQAGKETLVLSAIDLQGKAMWEMDFGSAKMRFAMARASPTGDYLAVWGSIKGRRKRGDASLWLLDTKGAVKARREFGYVRAVEFDPSGKNLIVTTLGCLHNLKPSDGSLIWRRETNTAISVHPPFVFGGQGKQHYLAFVCVEDRPDPRKGDPGRSRLQVRDLSTGRLLGEKMLEDARFRWIRKLTDERLLLRDDSRALIAELLY